MADGARTRDHRDHNPELYQLSYRHLARVRIARPLRHTGRTTRPTRPRSSVDRAAGFEPARGGSIPPGAILFRARSESAEADPDRARSLKGRFAPGLSRIRCWTTTFIPIRGRGGTGRRAGFRSRWASALGGSSPLARIAFSLRKSSCNVCSYHVASATSGTSLLRRAPTPPRLASRRCPVQEFRCAANSTKRSPTLFLKQEAASAPLAEHPAEGKIMQRFRKRSRRGELMLLFALVAVLVMSGLAGATSRANLRHAVGLAGLGRRPVLHPGRCRRRRLGQRLCHRFVQRPSAEVRQFRCLPDQVGLARHRRRPVRPVRAEQDRRRRVRQCLRHRSQQSPCRKVRQFRHVPRHVGLIRVWRRPVLRPRRDRCRWRRQRLRC